MNKFKRIFLTAIVAVAVLGAGWKADAQSVGPSYPLNGVTLLQSSTNQYVPGLITSTNATGTNMNQVYIGTSEFENLGLGLYSTATTNSTASGIITVRLAKSPDGVKAEYLPSLVFTFNQSISTNNFIFTNLSCVGVAGYFVTSVENTNALSTNQVWLIANRQSPKFGGYPASIRN